MIDLTKLASLNLTDAQKKSAGVFFPKIAAIPFIGSKFETWPQVVAEALITNLVRLYSAGVNPAVVAAQMFTESRWFESSVLLGIKASPSDKLAGNDIFRSTRETVTEQQMEAYKTSGDFLNLVQAFPDGKFDILIKDWFYYPQVNDVYSLVTLHCARYIKFMEDRATVHGMNLADVKKTVPSFLAFLEDSDPAKGLYAYASGSGYTNSIISIIADNGLDAWNPQV
jgi:hypothetical protein